ncbi:GAP family protein [Candidatus Collierbacteria bacterium]|nr:GAP family protein [Candidatus Collierbacteria bacterium]
MVDNPINWGWLTLTAITNGVNPCGIGMMVTFLGYMLVFGKEKKKEERLLKLGGVYIFSVFLTYLTVGLLFYNLSYYLQQSVLAGWLFKLIGAGLVAAGLIQIKDALWPFVPLHLTMPESWGRSFNRLMERSSLPAAALLGVVTTGVGTPCMMPLYLGTAVSLSNSGLTLAQSLIYFLYYNLIFIAPLIIVLLLFYQGRQVMVMREWNHRLERPVKGAMGVLLLAMGWFLIG